MREETADGVPAPAPYRYDDLSALYLNRTLKRSPGVSNTEGLVELSRSVMESQGVTTSLVRADPARRYVSWL
ncbi:hypothetical protein [Streptomyces sp. NPDC058664]|uniref:hypothetical protein n=1 Tax=unclassified Streptomyces TaxID=2593676 RepID=UPI00364C258D